MPARKTSAAKTPAKKAPPKTKPAETPKESPPTVTGQLALTLSETELMLKALDAAQLTGINTISIALNLVGKLGAVRQAILVELSKAKKPSS
jgi:hypothetical protein